MPVFWSKIRGMCDAIACRSHCPFSHPISVTRSYTSMHSYSLPQMGLRTAQNDDEDKVSTPTRNSVDSVLFPLLHS